MPEIVLPMSLSGLEIRTAILDRLSARLAQDGYLNLNLAYSHFTAKISIQIEAHDCGRVAEVKVEETVSPVAESNPDDEFLDKAEGEFEIEAASPNEVRVETGQEVPVLTKDGDGKPTIKGIKYSRAKSRAR
jgi:hypothetical protein